MSTLTADFTGSELIVKWSRDSRSTAILKDYVCEFHVNSILMRTKEIPFRSELKTSYRFEEMCSDQDTRTPNRTVTVKLRERDTKLNVSPDAVGIFTNERPAAPSFTVAGFLAPAGAANAMIHIAIAPVADADLAGYMIFRGNSAGFSPNGGNRIYMGTSTSYFDETAVVGTTYFYKVAAYDRFNSAIADLNFGSVISATGGAALEVADIKFKDVSFTPNADGVANRLRWTEGTAYRTVEGSNTTVSKTVPGSFIASGTTERYIFFDWDLGLMSSNTSLVAALSKANNRILATYKGGTDLIEGVTQPIFDGQKIITGTIGAAQLVTNQAVITGTAQILNGIITDAKIDNLNANKITAGFLDAARINTGSLNANKLMANTITGNLIQAGTITGDRISAHTITTDHMNVDSIHGNRIQTGTLSANRILANSITATQLIKTAALITETAQLENAVIRTAHIADLQVDTIKIKNDAVGRTYSAMWTGDRQLSRGVELEITKFTIPADISGKLFITGHWWWEADNDPDVRYRIVRTRNGIAGPLAVYNATGGHGEIGVFYSMSAVGDVVPGDIISLRMTHTYSGQVNIMMGEITGILTRR